MFSTISKVDDSPAIGNREAARKECEGNITYGGADG